MTKKELGYLRICWGNEFEETDSEEFLTDELLADPDPTGGISIYENDDTFEIWWTEGSNRIINKRFLREWQTHSEMETI